MGGFRNIHIAREAICEFCFQAFFSKSCAQCPGAFELIDLSKRQPDIGKSTGESSAIPLFKAVA